MGPAPRARRPRRPSALVTGGLRLSPNNPSFLETRDAIIQADQVLGGTHYDALWYGVRRPRHGLQRDHTSSADDGPARRPSTRRRVLAQQAPTISDPAPGGDGDGVAEPGETLRIVDELRDPNPTR